MSTKYSNPRIAPFEVIAKQNMDIVEGVARSFFPPPGNDESDLRQEALMSLHKASEKFNPYKGASFRTFAYDVVRKDVISFIRSANSKTNGQLNDAESMDVEEKGVNGKAKMMMYDVTKDESVLCPERVILSSEWLREFAEEYAKLSEDDKRSYSLIAIAGFTVSGAIKISGLDVKNRTQRARRILRKSVAESPIG